MRKRSRTERGGVEYRKLKECDAAFLTTVFSSPEYELYFAENDTTEEGRTSSGAMRALSAFRAGWDFKPLVKNIKP